MGCLKEQVRSTKVWSDRRRLSFRCERLHAHSDAQAPIQENLFYLVTVSSQAASFISVWACFECKGLSKVFIGGLYIFGCMRVCNRRVVSVTHAHTLSFSLTQTHVHAHTCTHTNTHTHTLHVCVDTQVSQWQMLFSLSLSHTHTSNEHPIITRQYTLPLRLSMLSLRDSMLSLFLSLSHTHKWHKSLSDRCCSLPLSHALIPYEPYL